MTDRNVRFPALMGDGIVTADALLYFANANAYSQATQGTIVHREVYREGEVKAGDGFEVAREILRQKLPTKIIILTLHTEEDLFRTAMELGIGGYILKEGALQELVAGVRALAAGQPYLSSALTARLLQGSGLTNCASKGLTTDRLTPTENQILQLIAGGQSSKEIGAALSIHYRTVENHRTNMCRKLGLEGAHALLRYALQNRSGLENE